MRKIGGWNQKGVQSYFFKQIEANYHSSSSCIFFALLFYFECSKNICKPLVCMFNDTKIVELVVLFLPCSFVLNAQRTFVAFQFTCPMTQKLLNWSRNEEEVGKCSMISTRLMMGDLTLAFSPIHMSSLFVVVLWKIEWDMKETFAILLELG